MDPTCAGLVFVLVAVGGSMLFTAGYLLGKDAGRNEEIRNRAADALVRLADLRIAERERRE